MSMAVDLLYNLAAVMLPYAVFVAAVLLTTQLGVMRRRVPASVERAGGAAPKDNSPLITASLCLGIGVGGFFNEIMGWQILQWHQMLSSRVPPVTLAALNFNMMWNGATYLMNLAMTVTGVALLFRATRRGATMSSRVLVGAMLGGWGLFAVVEGVIDHHLFGVHHVRSGTHELAWDLAYLILGALVMGIGTLLARSCRDASCPCRPTPPS